MDADEIRTLLGEMVFERAQKYRRRILRKRWRRTFAVAGLLVLLILLSAVGLLWKHLHREQSPAAVQGPTIFQQELQSSEWNTISYTPARRLTVQTTSAGSTAMDFRLAALDRTTAVDRSYFANVCFLGDSLTVGFSDYSINLGGALICGYTGVGPDAIVNRSAVKSSVRGSEVAMDVLTAAQPKKLYILLGTNTLTTLGAADRFLAYYGQMLDMLREALGEDCVIYVQSIPPVRPSAAAEKPGLASDVLRGVNEQLAQLAASKGCVYLDLWETFADGEGSLKEILAAPDGVHFSAGNGYGAWVTYLRNHAKYSASNSWTMGSAYSAE